MVLFLAAFAGLLMTLGSGLAMAAVPSGVVVGVDLDLPRLQESLTAESQGQWEVVRLTPLGPRAPRDVQPKLRALWAAYVEADFLRCLALIQDADIALDRLIEEAQPEPAMQAALVGAACAHGAGSKALAQQITRRLLVLELDLKTALRRTPPEFQQTVDRLRQHIEQDGRVTIKVRGVPENSGIEIDGRRVCAFTPCNVSVLKGEHIIVAKHVGFRSRTLPILLTADQTVTIALDEATAEDTQGQLALALGGAASAPAFASSVDTQRAVTQAWSVRVAIVLWKHEGRLYGALYDRALNKRWSQMVVDTGPSSARTISRLLIEEWKGVVVPKPFYSHPAFWVTSAAGLALVGGLVWWLAQPAEVKHVAVFR